jgi:hypothetical protein
MIREDTGNALRLRKDMEPSDIKVIMDLVRDMENPCAQNLWAKMEREAITSPKFI